MFYTPEQIEQLKNKSLTNEEYNRLKRIIIEDINKALIRDEKITYFNSLEKEIFEKENMNIELDKNGWLVTISKSFMQNHYSFSFNKK